MGFWQQADRHHGANDRPYTVNVTATFPIDVDAPNYEEAKEAAIDAAFSLIDSHDITSIEVIEE